MSEPKTNVSVQVSQARKQVWEEEAGELSTSQFIRTAVESFINETNQENNALSEDFERKVDSLLDQTASIETELKEVSNQSQIIYQEVQKTPESTREIASEIYDFLPTEDQLLGPTQKSLTEEETDDIFYNGYIRTGRVDHFADHIEEEQVKVQSALNVLVNEYQMASRINLHGEQRYYKDG